MTEKEIWMKVYLAHVHQGTDHANAMKLADLVVKHTAPLNND